MEQYFQSIPIVLVDVYATNALVLHLANATGIPANAFQATFVHFAAQSTGGNRRLRSGPVTDVDNSDCDTTMNIAFVRIVFTSMDPLEVERLINAIKDGSGVLHDVQNSFGYGLAECGDASFSVDRPVNPAPTPPPPPSPPRSATSIYYLFAIGFACGVFMLVNCFVILSRPVSAEAVLDDLVKEQRMPAQKGRARQREGMPLLMVGGAGE
jgi:hypothetical protein